MLPALASAVGGRLVLCLAVAIVCSPARSETYHWVQYGPGGLEARAITDQSACPAAQIDGAPATMTLRAAPGPDFPVSVCSLPIPAEAKSAAISDMPLALPAPEVKRIAVIGDTGCRLKESYIQACNDPQKWPFRLIAEVVAQTKPDLVIHVGDYHYRETACPPGNPGCAGSPFGDAWPAWRADFFAPAETLLEVAPWVFVRGNHEECSRGGKGWSRALAPDAFDVERGCNASSKPFVARVSGGPALAVVDVSAAKEERVDAAQVPQFHAQYETIAASATRPTWLLQHRPIWSAPGYFGGQLVGANKTLAAAASGLIPAQVTLMLSGHHHIFQVLEYDGGLPPQVVSGHGGDYLNAGPSADPAGWVINGVTVKGGLNMLGVFGFSVFEKQEGEAWRLTTYDRLGVALKTCLLNDRTASCAE